MVLHRIQFSTSLNREQSKVLIDRLTQRSMYGHISMEEDGARLILTFALDCASEVYGETLFLLKEELFAQVKSMGTVCRFHLWSLLSVPFEKPNGYRELTKFDQPLPDG